ERPAATVVTEQVLDPSAASASELLQALGVGFLRELPQQNGDRSLPGPIGVSQVHLRCCLSSAVYEYGCQAPSGVFSGGANRSRRRPRAASPSPPCSPPKQALRLHPHAACWAVGQGRKRYRSVGVRLGSGARPERPSIRGGPATVPSTVCRV